MSMRRNFDDPLYKKWRKDVYQRDKFQCQWPGCSCKSKLNAHHIKRWADCPALRYNVHNGITLCRAHHKMIHGNEEIYEAVFRKIIASKNNDNK